MRMLLTVISYLLVAMAVSAQDKTALPAKTDSSSQKLLEAKIRKAWEDYKNRNKAAFAAILADDFGEVTNDADGIFGRDAELSDIDHFSLSNYELGGFHIRPIGTAGAVMTYTANYQGTYEGTPLQMKAVYGEVWVKQANDWKLLWVQETKTK